MTYRFDSKTDWDILLTLWVVFAAVALLIIASLTSSAREVLDPLSSTNGAAWFSAFSTFLGSIAAATGLFMVYRTLVETRKSTDIPNRQLELNRFSLISTERAYIHYVGARWLAHYTISDGPIFWAIWIPWQNIGRTPAIDLKVNVAFKRGGDPVQGWLDAHYIDETVAGEALAQNAGIETRVMTLSGTEIDEILVSDAPLYIYGKARYRDVFGGEIHTTTFCVKLYGYSGDVNKYYSDVANPVALHLGNVSALCSMD